MQLTDFPTCRTYMTDVGVIELDGRTFISAFGGMAIPDDVWKRGFRLERKGFAQRYDYMAHWCDYQMEKAFKAGAPLSKVDGSGSSHG